MAFSFVTDTAFRMPAFAVTRNWFENFISRFGRERKPSGTSPAVHLSDKDTIEHEDVGVYDGDDTIKTVVVPGDEEAVWDDCIDTTECQITNIVDVMDTPSTSNETSDDQNDENNSSGNDSPWSPFLQSPWLASPTITTSPIDSSCFSAWVDNSSCLDSCDDTNPQLDTASPHSTTALDVVPKEPVPFRSHLLAPPFSNSVSAFTRAELRMLEAGSPVTRSLPFSIPTQDRNDSDCNKPNAVENPCVTSVSKNDKHQQIGRTLPTQLSHPQLWNTMQLDPVATMELMATSLAKRRTQLEKSMTTHLDTDEAMCTMLEQAQNRRRSLDNLVTTTMIQRKANIEVINELRGKLRVVSHEEQIMWGLTRLTYQYIGLSNDSIRMERFVRNICEQARFSEFDRCITVSMSILLAGLLTLTSIAVPWDTNAGLKVLLLLITWLVCWPICIGYCVEHVQVETDAD